MKRFIRYLYEYEKDKRIRNVGFIKIETGCEETIVQLQAKGFHNREERSLKLYLFYVENGEIVVVSQEEISLNAPVLSWMCTFSAKDVEGQENYSKICGLLVETGSGRRMAATWDDRCVDVSRVREYVAEAVTRREELSAREAGHEKENNGQSAQEEVDLSPAVREAGHEKENNGQSAQETEDYAQPQVKKISRQDISKLSRCEWKLANNRFLMHGYNNFHHLLLIDDGKSLKLGVPGIYHIKEAKCADTFGFGEFVTLDEMWSKEFSESQEDDLQNFGYWCRFVRRPRQR